MGAGRRLLASIALWLCGCSQNGVVPGSNQADNRAVPVMHVEDADNAASREIALAADRFIEFHASSGSTRDLYGAPGERACVAAVQSILDDAGFGFVGKPKTGSGPVVDVDAFRAALAADRTHWRRLSERQMRRYAAAGDVWIQGDGHPGGSAGQNHVGVCQDRGCRHVVSNSSADGSFTWSATPAEYSAYYASHGYPALPGAVYHHR